MITIAALLALSLAPPEAEKLLGQWTLVDGKTKGQPASDIYKQMPFEITKDKILIKGPDGKEMFVMDYTLDSKASPAAIDLRIAAAPVDSEKGKTAKGIVELDGDTLKICYDPEGKERPAKFEGDRYHSYTFKRKDAKKP